MKKYQPVLSFLFVLLFTITSFAQKTSSLQTIAEQGYDVQVTYAEFLGKTPPLRNLVPMSPATTERRAQNKKRRKLVKNFVGRNRFKSKTPNALPQGADPVWQSNTSTSRSIVPNEPLVNIDGMDINDANIGVPDQSIDVGNNYVIQMVNATLMQIFDKQGNEITQPIAANTIWSQIGFSSAGDPIVLYDHEADRWIITEFPNGNQLLFAITETSDPMGSWMAWNFATPNFPDYPKYSIWPNAYCVTTNEGGPDVLPNYFIDREAILNGDATVAIQRIVIPGIGGGPGFQASTPVDWTGTNLPADANPIILSLNDDAWGSSPQDQIDLHSISLDWDNPANSSVSTQNIITAAFDTNPCSAPTGGGPFPCIPQLGGAGLDGLPEIIMNQVHYRNFGAHESIVLNFITDATGTDVSGIRWMELRRTPGSDWDVYQEGTFAPNDGLHRFMGSICMDGAGNIGLAYNISGEDIYAGVRYTGRRASDPLGEMTIDEYTLVEGENPINNFTRFGDYNHMSIDPSNDRTFWFTAQYAGSGDWATRIVAFELRKDTTDIGPTALITPQSSPDLTANETVTVEIKNFGLDTQSVYNIGYIIDGNPAVIETANFTLYPDSTYTHTFVPQVDLSVIGDYNFKIFTSLEEDDAPLNDTLITVVSKLPMYDAGVSDILGLENGLCGTEAPATLVLTNFGTETLTSVNIDMMLNMTALPQINWTGSLASGESEIINVNLDNLLNGDNMVSAVTSLPNNQVDQVPVNDRSTRSFSNILDGVTVTLNLSTDDYPDETTWSLFDQNGAEIATGGPYADDFTLYQEEFCLDPELCYTFTIFDSFGDGICCNEGNGNYFFEDDEGNVLVSSTGEFSTQETNEFCATFVCSLNADVSYTPESGAGMADAAILIEVQSGNGPFVYSIDNGATFQNENIFDNLAGGTYEILVADGNSCTYEETITIIVCTLEVMAEVTSETGENINDGTISTTASNGTPPYAYSIDNGVTFQDSPDFSDLSADNYSLTVRDANGCISGIEVVVDLMVSTAELTFGYAIEVFPNPTKGVSVINIKGLNQSSVFLKFDVFDVNGKLVQASQLTRYDDTYTGQLSLLEYPSGTYFVRFVNKDIKRMLKLVKQ